MRIFWLLILLPFLFDPVPAPSPWGKVHYALTAEPLDVVIPCSPKDLETLELCIQSVRRYAENIRRIIVISKDRLTNSAEWFPESQFPFSKEMIAQEIFAGETGRAEEFLAAPNTRIGWIYQQFLKFYAPFTIPGISSNVLIVDSDVIFLQPVSFITKKGAPLFTPATEYADSYFEHAARLLPGLQRVYRAHSGIAHHMLFQRPILEDLFTLIRQTHGAEPWRAICRCIQQEAAYHCCMSEYEIYLNFVLLRTDQGAIRPLCWKNIRGFDDADRCRREGCSYIASHSWMREQEGD